MAKQQNLEPIILKLEKGVPIPTSGKTSKNPILEGKLKELFKIMELKQSFVFPKDQRYFITKVLKREFPEYVVKIASTDKTKNFFRIWRTM